MEGADRYAYVLNVGLPALPDRVGDGRPVPVAVWAGERYGAVMVVEDVEYEDGLFAMVYTYRRVDGGWEGCEGSGGFDWPGGRSSSAAAGLESREVLLEGGKHGHAHLWTCHLVEGFAGAAARWVELDEGSYVDRRPVPRSGAVLAVRQGNGAATVRVLGEQDDLLGECAL